jgi:hypothetical protein
MMVGIAAKHEIHRLREFGVTGFGADWHDIRYSSGLHFLLDNLQSRLIDFDRINLPLRSHRCRQIPGEVTTAGAQIRHSRSWFDTKLFDHLFRFLPGIPGRIIHVPISPLGTTGKP